MSFFRRPKPIDDSVIVDSVTGTFNRRQLDRDLANGLVGEQTTATLMIEIDEFDQYVDRKGAPTPDQVLERVAWVIMATVRTTDVVYRHAAASFCVLLPSTSDADAVAVAARLRQNVEKMPLLSCMSVSISIGVASGPSEDVAGAVDRALEALNRAVSSGGGVVETPARAPEPDEVAELAPASQPLAPPVLPAGSPLPPPSAS